MPKFETIDFSTSETMLLADILQSAFEMVEVSGADSETLELFGDLLDAMDAGCTCQFNVEMNGDGGGNLFENPDLVESTSFWGTDVSLRLQ